MSFSVSLMRTLLVVPPLPVRNIPPSWAETFCLIDQPSLLPLAVPLLQIRLDMEAAAWRVAFYWAVKKKWDSRLKIPIQRKLAKLHEPRGELLFRTLELCDRCYDPAHSVSQHYLHAPNWFLHLVQEAKRLGDQAIIANESFGKTPTVKERYAIIADLKDLQNPANPKTSIHFHRLIEVALTLEKHDEFSDRYWKPFLHACSQWTQLTDSKSCQETFIEDNKIVQRCGQGRGKITILKLPSKI